MKRLIISTYKSDKITPQEGVDVIYVGEKQIGKCRGCMACRRLNKCINYDDDAQLCLPIINSADHIEFYLQPDGMIQRLMDRVLYALNGEGKTFAFQKEDAKEVDYLRRLLVWAKYTEVQ